jgi:hypothetical protein
MLKGALPRDDDGSKPELESYLKASTSLPTPPAYVDRSTGDHFQMYLNDQLGDCTVADMFNLFAAVSDHSNEVPGGIQFTDAEARKVYSDPSVGNYQGTPATDNGSTLEDVCQYGVKTGFTDVNGKVHKIAAWAEVNAYTNLPLLKQLTYVFGAVYLGVAVGNAEQSASSNGQPWTLNKAGRNVGPNGIDHCVSLVYSAVGVPGVVNNQKVATWGMAQEINQNWAETNIGQAVVVITSDWIQSNGKSIDGLNLAQLIADSKGH